MKSLACGHSPIGRQYRWGCIELTRGESTPQGLLEGELGYPLPTSRETDDKALHRGELDAFWHELRARGFDTVLTARGPLSLQQWRSLGAFQHPHAPATDLMSDFEWVGAHLIRSVPRDPEQPGRARIWTLATRAANALELGPVSVEAEDWRVVVSGDRRHVMAQWCPCGTARWRPLGDWPNYDPRLLTRGLPWPVWQLVDSRGLLKRYSAMVSGDTLLTTEVLEPAFVRNLSGTWHPVANEWGCLGGAQNPEERALCRWITRAADIDGSEVTKLRNFLAQRWTREELAAFRAEVRYLRWPIRRGKSPWATAAKVAWCLESKQPDAVASPALARDQLSP